VLAYKYFGLLILLLLSLAVCNSSSPKVSHSNKNNQIHSDTLIKFNSQKSDTSFSLSFKNVFTVFVQIKYPKVNKSNSKNILLLHGYNLPSMQWCEKTDFCRQALDSGYTLIIPNFGKTTYQYKFYKETIPKYRIYPTRFWMLDTLIPILQNNFQLLLPDTTSFVAGISTGGRGAVLLGADRPEIFRALASLSGDFDQTKMAGEPIYTGYYGNYSSFSARWKNEDNPMQMVKKWTVPCFLAHGEIDKVSPVEQTKMFSKALYSNKPNVIQEIFIPSKNGHDYVFWSACTKPILQFFYRVAR
jgi:pimeloyl-ACP methyl ester carboxylesterase